MFSQHRSMNRTNTGWIICVCVPSCKAFRGPCSTIVPLSSEVSVNSAACHVGLGICSTNVMHVTQRWQLNTRKQRTGHIWCSAEVTAMMQCWPAGVKTHTCSMCTHAENECRQYRHSEKYLAAGCTICFQQKYQKAESLSFFNVNWQLLCFLDRRLVKTEHLKASFQPLENSDGHFLFTSDIFPGKQLIHRWAKYHESNH